MLGTEKWNQGLAVQLLFVSLRMNSVAGCRCCELVSLAVDYTVFCQLLINF